MRASLLSSSAVIGPRLAATSALACVALAIGCQEKTETETPTSPTPANQQPERRGSIQAQRLEEDAETSVDVENNFFDPDGDSLTYSATSQPSGIVRVATSGSVVTIRGEDVGRATVAATAKDPAGAYATQNFGVTVTERPVGVCDRTAQVRDAILAALGFTDCASVTRSQLAEIDSLDATGSGLSSVQPDDFALLSGLTVLRLGDNQLSHLPRSVFSSLSSLESLDLPNNQLQALPPGVFSGLDSLKYLELHNNLLSQLPNDAFSGLSGLRVLGLDANQLSELPQNVFSRLGRLESLDLTANDLQRLASGVFANLSGLQQLRLSTNKVSTLPSTVFSDLSNLEALFLSNNILRDLPVGVFAGLSKLKELRLDTNQLSSLPQGVFVGLSELRMLSLEGNRVDPFRSTFRFERTDSTSLSAPSPATVRLVLPMGAPIALTVGLSIGNATVTAPSATVARGDSVSQVFTVRKGPLDRPARVAGSVLTKVPDAITGIIFGPPDELVLFGTTNQAPEVTGGLQPLTRNVGSSRTVNVAAPFNDPEGDALSFRLYQLEMGAGLSLSMARRKP